MGCGDHRSLPLCPTPSSFWLRLAGLTWEAIQRLGSPEPVAGKTVMVVAAIDIVVNAVRAWLFASGSKDDINLRAAFLHIAADAAKSLNDRAADRKPDADAARLTTT